MMALFLLHHPHHYFPQYYRYFRHCPWIRIEWWCCLIYCLTMAEEEGGLRVAVVIEIHPNTLDLDNDAPWVGPRPLVHAAHSGVCSHRTMMHHQRMYEEGRRWNFDGLLGIRNSFSLSFFSGCQLILYDMDNEGVSFCCSLRSDGWVSTEMTLSLFFFLSVFDFLRYQ